MLKMRSRKRTMTYLSLISESILLLALGWAAMMDIRMRKIPVIFIAVLFACGLALQLIINNLKLYEIILGCAVGGVLILISLLSKGAIGIGDGLMFAASGAFLGLYNNLWLLLLSLGLSAVAGLILMIAIKLKGKQTIPFIPFMFSAYICLLMIL